MALAGLALPSLFMVVNQASAAEQKEAIVDRVVATVNDEPILLSELRERAAPVLAALFSQGSDRDRMLEIKKLYADLLERLIEARLIEGAAARDGISIDESEISQAVKDVRLRNQMSEDEFWEAVRAQGLSETKYKADIRMQLLRFRVLNQRVRARVNITEKDIRRVYNRQSRSETLRRRFRVSHILFPIQDGNEAEAQSQAQAARDALEGGTKSFDELVVEHDGGELGWLDEGDLPPSLEQPLKRMKVAQLSTPLRGPAGFHILRLDDEAQGAAKKTSYEAQKQGIYQALLEKALAEQEKVFLRELRRKAVVERKL